MKFRVKGVVTIPVVTYVEAESSEKAMAIAFDRSPENLLDIFTGSECDDEGWAEPHSSQDLKDLVLSDIEEI